MSISELREKYKGEALVVDGWLSLGIKGSIIQIYELRDPAIEGFLLGAGVLNRKYFSKVTLKKRMNLRSQYASS